MDLHHYLLFDYIYVTLIHHTVQDSRAANGYEYIIWIWIDNRL